MACVPVTKTPSLPCRRLISSSRLQTSSASLDSTSKCSRRRATMSGKMRRQTRIEAGMALSARRVGSLERSVEEAGEAGDRLALGHQRVLDRVGVAHAERHAADQLLIVGNADRFGDEAMERRE